MRVGQRPSMPNITMTEAGQITLNEYTRIQGLINEREDNEGSISLSSFQPAFFLLVSNTRAPSTPCRYNTSLTP